MVARPRRPAGAVLLDAIERIGHALPDPATLFLSMAAVQRYAPPRPEPAPC